MTSRIQAKRRHDVRETFQNAKSRKGDTQHSNSLRRFDSIHSRSTQHCTLFLQRRMTMMIASRSMLKPMPSVVSNSQQHVMSVQRLHRRTFFWGGRNSNNKNSRSYQKSRGSFFSTASSSRDPGLEVTSVVSNPKEVEGPRGVPSRTEQIRRLQTPTIRSDGKFDVLVIGGGATGAGIALDAAQRGLQTACIERGDFASETSSRSTKLIWVRFVDSVQQRERLTRLFVSQFFKMYSLSRLASSTWQPPRPSSCLPNSFPVPSRPCKTLSLK